MKDLKNINKHGIIWNTILASAFVIVSLYHYQSKNMKTYSLYDTLDNYGFSTIEQKEAIENLMHRSSIIAMDESLQDKFPVRHDYKELVKDILEFVKLTQEHLTIRTGSQERWEVKPPEWMMQNIEENFQNLKILGFVDAIKPTNTTIDTLCVLGSTMKGMENRINYSDLLYKDGLQVKSVILLAGERKVALGVDGTKEELTKIAADFQVDFSRLTETHLIEEVYKNSHLHNKLPTYIIDTKAGDLPRPTTQTTILELIKWLKQHEDITNITFVSNQPYVKYQEAVIKEVLRNSNFPMNFEVVGSARSEKEQIKAVIEALGSYIFAKTPDVLLTLNKTIDNPDLTLMSSFKELYAKQPLVYHNLETLFHHDAVEITGSSNNH